MNMIKNLVKMNEHTQKKSLFLPDYFFFFSYDTIIKSVFFIFFEQNINLRLSSDLYFYSSEERVSLFISGSKTRSSGGRLGSFKLFLIIKKR